LLLLLPAVFTATRSSISLASAQSTTLPLVAETDAGYYARADVRHAIAQMLSDTANAAPVEPENPVFQTVFLTNALLLESSAKTYYSEDGVELEFWCGAFSSPRELDSLDCKNCWGLTDVAAYQCVKGKSIRYEYVSPCSMMLSANNSLEVGSFRSYYYSPAGELCSYTGLTPLGSDAAIGATLHDTVTGEKSVAFLYSGAVVG